MTTRVSRRSPSRRRSTSGRRPTTWENLIINHPHGVVGETVVTDITPEPMASDLVGRATIVRCILNLRMNKDTSATSNTLQRIGLGITVMTNDAFAALAVPDPLSDFQQDWYYWTTLQQVFASGNIDGPAKDHDNRTARLLRGGFKLVLISESLSLNDIDTNLSIMMRNLWKIV